MEQLRSPSEIQIQREIWETIWKRHPEARRLLFHVPNESTYNNSQQASSGVIPGVPDMLFVWRGFTWYFELKDDTGRLSDYQKVFHAQLATQGVDVYVFYSAKPCIEMIENIICGMTGSSVWNNYKSPFSKAELYPVLLSELQAKKQKARIKRAGK